MPPSCALLGGFAISARGALLWQHYGNAWQSPAIIRQAQRRPHARAIKSTRLLRVRRYLQRGRPPFHFIHTARVLQREREMLASTCLYSLYA